MKGLILSGCAALALGTLLAGCNTFEGVGQDVAAAGNWLSNTSQDVRNSDNKPSRQQQQQARSGPSRPQG